MKRNAALDNQARHFFCLVCCDITCAVGEMRPGWEPAWQIGVWKVNLSSWVRPEGWSACQIGTWKLEMTSRIGCEGWPACQIEGSPVKMTSRSGLSSNVLDKSAENTPVCQAWTNIAWQIRDRIVSLSSRNAINRARSCLWPVFSLTKSLETQRFVKHEPI